MTKSATYSQENTVFSHGACEHSQNSRISACRPSDRPRFLWTLESWASLFFKTAGISLEHLSGVKRRTEEIRWQINLSWDLQAELLEGFSKGTIPTPPEVLAVVLPQSEKWCETPHHDGEVVELAVSGADGRSFPDSNNKIEQTGKRRSVQKWKMLSQRVGARRLFLDLWWGRGSALLSFALR